MPDARGADSGGLLKATRQSRKLMFAGGALLLGVGLLYLAAYLPDRMVPIGLTAGVFALVVAAFIALRLVRCPECSLAWTQWALGNQRHDKWLTWLMSFDKCPKCGLTGDEIRGGGK